MTQPPQYPGGPGPQWQPQPAPGTPQGQWPPGGQPPPGQPPPGGPPRQPPSGPRGPQQPYQPQPGPQHGQQPPGQQHGPQQSGPQQHGPQQPHGSHQWAPGAFGPGQPQQPGQWPQQPGYQQQPKKPASKKLLLGIGGGVLALLLLIIGGVVVKQTLDRQAAEEEARQAAEAFAAQKAARVEAAGATVDQFLNGMAKGSADDVLGLLADTPDDRALLNDQALKAARDAAPVTDVEIVDAAVPDSLAEATVTAKYAVGGDGQETTFTLTPDGDGWLLNNGLGALSVDTKAALQVNGQKIEGSTTQPVFYGGYAMSTGSDRTEYSDNKVVVPGPDPTSWTGEAKLTKKGEDFVFDQARRNLDGCAKSKELAPKNCPFAVLPSSNREINRSSVRWTIRNDPLRGRKVIYGTDSAIITMDVDWQFRATGTCGGQSCTIEGEDKWSRIFTMNGVSTSRPTIAWL